MQATGPFYEIILQNDQEFQVFNLKIPLSPKQNYLWEKKNVSVSANANSLLSVVSALGNPAPKVF